MLRVMPSWSTSNPPSTKTATPPGNAATAIERARRLLEQVFGERRRDDPQPPPSKP